MNCSRNWKTRRKIVAELNVRGLTEKEITPGQYATSEQILYLEMIPQCHRHNADGSATIKTHNVVAVEKQREQRTVKVAGGRYR